MRASGRSPRQLAVFHFAVGDVYVSDQDLGATDGLANEYSGIVEDWGELRGAGDPSNPDASEIRQMSITLWNGGDSPFSDYFLEENPENVQVDLYQWFAGINKSHKALIDRFVCQDPIATDEVSRLLRIDLCSLPMLYDGPVGDIVKIADWPNAKDEDLGKYIPVIFGDAGYVTTLCVRTGPKATLNGSILEDTLTITAYEDLDEEGFTQSGTIQIDAERMTYSSRTEHDFIISQRGADGTIGVEHLNQAEIQQHVTDFTYVICAGPVYAIANVKVGGILAPSAIYTVYTSLNPVRIVFSEKPYALDYSRGSTFLEMQMDGVAGGNTAYQPHLAYDSAAVTSACQINETYPLLALQQSTENPDRGEIVKAYLAVEWWASGAALQHDRVAVSIQSIGQLGYLERPSEYDDLSLDAEVDIDHGHTHTISGEHAHVFTDPTVATQESPHGHASSGLSEQLRVHGNRQLQLSINETGSVTFQGPASHSSATLHCRTSPNYGCKVLINGSYVLVGSGDSYTSVSVGSGTISLTFKNTQWSSGTMMIYEIWIDYVITSSIQPSYTGVTAQVIASGANADNSDKAPTDVFDLSTGNREIDINSSGLPTRTVVELFDITENVGYSWDWFTGQEVRAEYQGTVDDATVFVLHVFFDVEYRRSGRIFSDDVTCEVIGLIDDAAGTVTGTPSAQITRPDHVRQWLSTSRGGLPESRIDAVSFAATGARYTAEGHTFDGVLDGAITVREAEKKLARECRSRWFWDAGTARMQLRERHAAWTIDKALDSSNADIRLKGMAMQRKNVADMLNRVNLYYYRDWTSSAGDLSAYLSCRSVQNNASVAEHGIRERNDRFLFDLVRSAAMAEDLADFYLEDGAPSAFYTIEAFLPYFDLQKEDHISLTHDFMSLSKAAMRIADIERVFGSGKLKRMNLLRIIAETWYRLIRIAKNDSVKVADLLRIDFSFADEIINQVGVTDLLRFGFNPSDTVSVSDALAIVVAWVISTSEIVTVTESLSAHMGIAASDSVKVQEVYLDINVGKGFGLGSFGIVPFGSLYEHDSDMREFASVADELIAALAAVLGDTVTCTDALLFSSGFGSPWSEGEGFGAEPFGR